MTKEKEEREARTQSLELIGPKEAAEFLAQSTGNRKTSHTYVRMIANDMLNGNFSDTGDSIRFDWNGRFIDGHHRCLAIIMSETFQTITVQRGLDPKASSKIDTGRSRSGSDVLTLAGYDNAKHLSYICRLRYNMEEFASGMMHGSIAQRSVPNHRILFTVEERPILIESAAFSSSIPVHVKKYISPSTLGFVHSIAVERNYRASFEKFALQLGSDSPIKIGTGATALRSKLMHSKENRHESRMSRDMILALLIKAYRADFSGKSVQKIFWRVKGDKPESFPQMPRRIKSKA